MKRIKNSSSSTSSFEKEQKEINNEKNKEKKGIHSDIDRFTGPIGAIFLMLGLTFFIQILWFSCSQYQCDEKKTFFALKSLIKFPDILLVNLFPFSNIFSIYICLGWFLIQYILHVIIPGKYILGSPLPDGSRLLYKLNGLTCYIITLLILGIGFYRNIINEEWIIYTYKNLGSIIVTFQIFSWILALLFYLKGFIFNQGNPSHNIIIDYFYGYEPNPRLWNIVVTDFKWFLEGRALILWTVMSIFFALKQWTTLHMITSPMILVLFFHFIYVFHYFYYESNALSMIDFTADHMGWMLTWGNVVWVPFAYTTPEWFLLNHYKQSLSAMQGLLCIGLFILGYTIFSDSNLQRKNFRENPGELIWGRPPKVIETESGRKLLASGWWGLARKMNYTGDIIQSFAYGLPCMSLSLIPFLNGIFLTALLIQRERRDNTWCHQKYGKDWEKYCQEVPYRLIPYIY